MQASAGFVSASALGMACGPALAGLLQTKFKIFNLTLNQDTLPGWVMAVAWLVYLIWLWFSFREPNRDTEENHVPQESSAAQNDKLEKGFVQPLLASKEHDQNDEDGDEECDASEEAPGESRQPANSLGTAYRLLTPSVKLSTELLDPKSIHDYLFEPLYKKLGKAEIIMIPLTHNKNYHHTLLVLDATDQAFYHYDSMQPRNIATGESYKDAKKMERVLRDICHALHPHNSHRSRDYQAFKKE